MQGTRPLGLDSHVPAKHNLHTRPRHVPLYPSIERQAHKHGRSRPPQAVSINDLLATIDVVEYVSPRKPSRSSGDSLTMTRLGRVMSIDSQGLITMEPLVEEEEDVFMAEDVVEERVPCSSILSIIECDVSERQDTGPSNPHGEHAHTIYRVLKPLQDGVWTGRST
mmetsp:Transcript_11393/g.20002  ORF Transcript_11393/g.20002 Transcript_11393/m.20002 type:complete len:166 (-) Transcript_11393:613-1110(-)